MPRRRRLNLAFWGSIVGAFLGVTAWILAATAWDMSRAIALMESDRGWALRPRIDWMLWERAVEAIVTAWVFALGASIGSFLNVVAYRMPLGIGLSKSGSRCPWCLGAIRPRDNVPILGWLGLKGRCHTCRLPISSRYPIVEAVTGSLFAILFIATVGFGGRMVPGIHSELRLDIGSIILDGRWDLIFLLLQQIATLGFVWAAALMMFDGHSPPLRFWSSAVAFLLTAAVGLPAATAWINSSSDHSVLYPIALYPLGMGWPIPASWPTSTHAGLSAISGGVVGAGIGAVMALIARPFTDRNQLPEASRSATAFEFPLPELPTAEPGREGLVTETFLAGPPLEMNGSDEDQHHEPTDHSVSQAGPVMPTERAVKLAAQAQRELVESTGSPLRALSIIGLASVTGLGIGWQTLLVVVVVSLVLSPLIAAIRWRELSSVASLRRWLCTLGIAWTLGLVLVLATWSLWLKWIPVLAND